MHEVREDSWSVLIGGVQGTVDGESSQAETARWDEDRIVVEVPWVHELVREVRCKRIRGIATWARGRQLFSLTWGKGVSSTGQIADLQGIIVTVASEYQFWNFIVLAMCWSVVDYAQVSRKAGVWWKQRV